MAYTIDQYLEDIEDWPDAELEVDRDADFEHDQWLRERETGYQLNNMFSVEVATNYPLSSYAQASGGSMKMSLPPPKHSTKECFLFDIKLS